ncbi:hypothetical protein OSB04_019366 [Centaurea solstitialis]|uniref:Uncharacterized protein n=1 Tax=Centaurea solstitialis TaxID=347529 RepID=A0AA38SQQ4_9ASTR|nr:hypothetical protein OSB04_019366 [Centaurea solstitialis]
MAGGAMSVIIPKRSMFPLVEWGQCSTFADNQANVLIQVYEGERVRIRDNNFLGRFDLAGIPSAPKTVPEILIRFSIDEDGILEVPAENIVVGKSKKITITNDKGQEAEEYNVEVKLEAVVYGTN